MVKPKPIAMTSSNGKEIAFLPRSTSLMKLRSIPNSIDISVCVMPRALRSVRNRMPKRSAIYVEDARSAESQDTGACLGGGPGETLDRSSKVEETKPVRCMSDLVRSAHVVCNEPTRVYVSSGFVLFINLSRLKTTFGIVKGFLTGGVLDGMSQAPLASSPCRLFGRRLQPLLAAISGALRNFSFD
jgi:hypothetical protein